MGLFSCNFDGIGEPPQYRRWQVSQRHCTKDLQRTKFLSKIDGYSLDFTTYPDPVALGRCH